MNDHSVIAEECLLRFVQVIVFLLKFGRQSCITIETELRGTRR